MRLRLMALVASLVGVALLVAAELAQPFQEAESAGGRDAECSVPAREAPVDCVPRTFDTFDIPFGELPGGRVDASGNLDPTSSPEDAHAGAFVAAEALGLFGNFEWLHWLPTAPSDRDPETGEWSGGDLDGFPSGWGSTGLGIAGDCLYWGRSNSTNTTGPGVTRDVKIFKIQSDPENNPPVEVGTMPQLTISGGETAVRDRELRAYSYTSTDGVEHLLMVRAAARGTGGDVIAYTMDPETCLPLDDGATAADVLAHEFYLWHDPDNPNRLVVVSQTYGSQAEDLVFTAITDEHTGEVLKEPLFLASFTLEEIGGPVRDEVPDETGLYSDGRFTDYRHLMDTRGRPGASQRTQGNDLHSGTVSDDGERFYAGGGTAGMYILNTEMIANRTNAELAAGNVCNQTSTNVWVDGQVGGLVDVTRLVEVADDCAHPVLNSDPGVLALLRSDRSELDKLVRYTRLEERSRFDFAPPFVAAVGVHSAVPVPNRPSRSRDTPERRPAYVVITEEWPFGPCPERGFRILTIESEINPMMVGGHAMSDSLVENCLEQPVPPGSTIRPMMHAHNPTVLENLVFVNWLGHGVRAIDISNPFNPREVGHARPVPWGDIMTYPEIHNGLIYVGDNHTGLHVFKYTGPRADEVPQDVGYSSNRTSPQRPGSPRDD